MCRLSFIFLVTLAVCFSGACKREAPDFSSKPKSAGSVHGSGEQKVPPRLMDTLKLQKLANFQSATIGNAFDSYRYLTKKEWMDAQAKNGKFLVRFVGWIDPVKVDKEALNRGIIGKGIEVRFEITHDGTYYASTAFRLEAQSDGRVDAYEMDDLAGVLSKIYANKELKL